jgi:hypothetical protein
MENLLSVFKGVPRRLSCLLGPKTKIMSRGKKKVLNTKAYCEVFYLQASINVPTQRSSRCLIKCHAMQPHEGVELELHAFLTSVVGGGEHLSSRPSLLTVEERNPTG